MEPPRVTESRVVYENRWMRLREDRIVRADGTPGVQAYLEKPNAAVIVPVQDGHVWLIEQYRHATGRRWWELPQGAWEQAPDADAEALARGELREETGLTATGMRRIGGILYAPGFSGQEGAVWLATGLEEGPQALEETEADLRVARVSYAEMEAMIADGRVRDAATLAGWHMATRAGLPG
jgi:ADP-ribose pyrophosphatase